MEDGWAVTDQLVGLGLDPLGIELVVLTHMHQDHVGAVAQLPRATFVVDGARMGGGDHSGFLHGYRRQLYDYDYDWRALDFGGANRSAPSPPSATRSTCSTTARCGCSRRRGTRRGT